MNSLAPLSMALFLLKVINHPCAVGRVVVHPDKSDEIRRLALLTLVWRLNFKVMSFNMKSLMSLLNQRKVFVLFLTRRVPRVLIGPLRRSSVYFLFCFFFSLQFLLPVLHLLLLLLLLTRLPFSDCDCLFPILVSSQWLVIHEKLFPDSFPRSSTIFFIFL